MKGISGIGMMIFLCSFLHEAKSQDPYQVIDSVTYRMYREEKWDSLVQTGKKAIRDSIDYYFLRLRIGVAEFQKKKYISASQDFFKAASFNSADPFLLQHQYYSFLYSNRPEDARLVASRMPDYLKTSLNVKPRIIDNVSAEGGITLSSDNKILSHPDLMKGDSIYGEKDLYRNSYYVHLDLIVNISPRINLTIAYNYLNFLKVRYYQYAVIEDKFISRTDSSWGYINGYTFPKVAYDTAILYNISQNEFHLGSTIVLPSRFKIQPFVHLIGVSYPNPVAHQETQSVEDTLYYSRYDTLQPYHTFSFTRKKFSFTAKDTSFYNFLAGLTVTKDIGIFTLSLSGSYSKLNNHRQYQAGGSLTYFPLGNLDLYGTTMLTGFFQGKDKRLIFGQLLGGHLFSGLWAESSVVVGDLTNANLNNGLVVYNNSDKIDYRLGVNFIYLLSKHLEVYLLYQYFQKESTGIYYVYNPPDQATTTSKKTENTKYNTNSFIGGIKWKL